jgi:hypothetical protein
MSEAVWRFRLFKLAFSIELITHQFGCASMRAFGYIAISCRKVLLRVLAFVIGEPCGASESLISLHIH